SIEAPETVTLQLSPTVNYNLGVNSLATLYLHDIRAPSVFGTAGSGQATLSWNMVPGATQYQVRRSTTSGTGYGAPIIVNGLTYVDTSVVNNTAYYYVVTALTG